MDSDKLHIRDALLNFEEENLQESALRVLDALGYVSDRTLNNQTGDAKEFFSIAPAETQARTNLIKNALEIRLLFQYTDEEIRSPRQNRGTESLNSRFDEQESDGFLFTVVQLREQKNKSRTHRVTYSRSEYAKMTREVNRAFIGVPSVVLFFASHWLTIGFVARRTNMVDQSKDVIERVSLIKDIDLLNPHRAHIDLLEELSIERLLEWMNIREIDPNFQGLNAAWLAKLDTEELNRSFYSDLFNWFEKAVNDAKFPKHVHAEEHVIRLITRLMFVWFMKEKGLIANDLFIEQKIANLIEGYDTAYGDSYYRAVLQNLFFATLNTPITDRGFAATSRSSSSKYHYRDLVTNPSKLQELFNMTPFINGGLFECVDSMGKPLVDCFTDSESERRKLSYPNHLFFGKEGIISIFNRFRFTIEENTPVEHEVALDPELLGSVFENLLAAYNPETRETARKRTGSYYTPRPVVDYMVRESISLVLAAKTLPDDVNPDDWGKKVRALLDEASKVDDGNREFNDLEIRRLVKAIAYTTVLDPAVGSGAFPMRVLHVLTLALRRLDPDNNHWSEIQAERAARMAERAYANAFDKANDRIRKEALDSVEETFKNYRDSDFGRKLYLIQYSLFGVDIQPIACQIAKLRFFISLAIEQEVTEDRKTNYGIRPLPNLETKFIAADSLLKVERQKTLGEMDVVTIEDELRLNREKHFNANSIEAKDQCRKNDRRLRINLVDAMIAEGYGDSHVEKVAAWDPYDQNAVAQWFEPEYMFGVVNFDVVIGNPPYIQLQKNQGELRKRYQNQGYEIFESTGDVYQLFYERGVKLATNRNGILSYITSNSWLKARYGKRLRQFFSNRHTPLTLIEMGKNVFENATVDTAVLIIRNGRSKLEEKCVAVDVEKSPERRFPPLLGDWGTVKFRDDRPWMALSNIERSIMDKMEAVGTPLKELDISIYYGIKTGYNDAFIVDNETRDHLIAMDRRSKEILKPMLRGRDIARYRAKWAGLWLIDTHNGYEETPPIDVNEYPAIKSHLDQFFGSLKRRQDQGITPYNLRNCAYHEIFTEDKIIWLQLVDRCRFALDQTGMYAEASSCVLTGTNLEVLCGILNSQLIYWYMQHVSPTSGKGTHQWKITYLREIPIVYSANLGTKLKNLVHQMLIKIDRDSNDHEELQKEIETQVYELYDLSPREIDCVRKI